MKDLYKCPECGATDYAKGLEEDSLYDGYRCNNCLVAVMILQKPVIKKHIVVFEDTKKDFEKLKDKKGMTQDGLIRYFIEKEKKGKK